MTPHRQAAAEFQYVLEHDLLANQSTKSDNTSGFRDTLTAWPLFLNHAARVAAMGDVVVNALPAALLAEGYLRALQPWQDKWE